MNFSVRHITSFSYAPSVRESLMEVRMQPRSDGLQRCHSFSLDVSPDANVMTYRDFLGNTVHHFDIPESHSRVDLTAQALVEVEGRDPIALSDAGSWDDLDAMTADGEYWETLAPSHYARPSDALAQFASGLKLVREGNPFECLVHLNENIFKAFDYVPQSTEVDSPIDDTLRTRQGVCQDFAHIMIALLRRLRIPARYVSGYLAHGTKSQDRSPEGATHAWVEALLPNLSWVAFDPTNNLVCGERHIRVAIGRDYADVPPTRGVYKGEVESGLSVSVNVALADAPLRGELPPLTVVRSKPARTRSTKKSQHEQQQQQQQQ